MTDRKAVIKNADMSEDMQQDAVDCATQAMEKYNIEKDIAAYIKKVTHPQNIYDWHLYRLQQLHLFIYFFAENVSTLMLSKMGMSLFSHQNRSEDI